MPFDDAHFVKSLDEALEMTFPASDPIAVSPPPQRRWCIGSPDRGASVGSGQLNGE